MYNTTNQDTNPKPIEILKGIVCLKDKATTNNSTAVAGNPHNTPSAKLLKFVIFSPCTLNQNKLNKLTNGNAAIIPPYLGKYLATSVTAPMIIADTMTFVKKNTLLLPL